jgi:hypothetical protein
VGGGGDVGEKVSRETHLLIEIRNQNLICGCGIPAANETLSAVHTYSSITEV